ncbi:hypothetical protein EXE26_04930 [Acinetobacter junii]|nr:hypothetical protein [Acinetobacter junii]RZG69619.1 hypothetical protein EXE26_04930 [Acinetobacter junii]
MSRILVAIHQKEQELKKASQIKKIQEEIAQLNQQYDISMKKSRENWLSMFDQSKNVIEAINKFNVGVDLNINPSIEFESLGFAEFLRRFINQQSDVAQKYSTSFVSSAVELQALFDNILTALHGNVIRFKQGVDLQSFTKEFFDKSWFKFKYDVVYDGDNYNSMSQGKKAFVVLKMSLDCSDSKCPIIIDQPEDDLDNRAIYSELVAYLKTKKSKRQIILVTHNANVVVNADSELVVVANQHGSQSPNNFDKKFQYKYGSIECLIKSATNNPSTLERKTIKEHICEILEGGDKAFKLRERKYNLS